MKLYILKKKLNFEEADSLIERYYDGLTSNEEEKQLREFLSNKNLPVKYKPEQAMFGYFESKKTVRKINLRTYYQWAAVAAIVLISAFSVQIFSYENSESYALVNGKKITDLTQVENLALNSMNEVKSKNEIEESLNSINTNEIISQQLEVFNEIDK